VQSFAGLGRVGAWIGGYGPPAAVDRERVAELEQLGYSAFWFGEAPGGKDAFTRAATLLAATESITIATGIASIWGRDPMNTASAIRTIGEAFPGRFIAGLGISHPPLVAARGDEYRAPVATMTDYLTAMSGVQHESPAPTVPVPIVLAALRPRMLSLSASHADGAHPYFVTAEHTARARAALGPGKLLAPELAVLLESDPVEARRLARLHTGGFYLQAPNYVENLRWLGFGDDDFVDGGSDALVDAIVAWGDEQAIVNRIREHLDAGADHVCLQPIVDTGVSFGAADRRPDVMLTRLADAVCDL
jgi:probable F420-dependent oxidoreductase